MVVNTSLQFHTKIQVRALEFHNGGVRTSENLLHKSVENTGKTYQYQLLRNFGN